MTRPAGLPVISVEEYRRLVAAEKKRTGAGAPHRGIVSRAVRSTGGKREDLGGMYLRSMAEANVARWLRWMTECGEIGGWRYEAHRFDLPNKRGKNFYIDDFSVWAKGRAPEVEPFDWLLEVKFWMDPTSRAVLNRMKRYHPGIEIRVIGKKEYAALARQVAGLIHGWETQRARKETR